MFNIIVPKLEKAGFSSKMAMLIAAQAAHETGNFTSKVLKRNNNLFGMRVATIRATTTEGDTDQDSYANYTTIDKSIEDYILYCNARRINKKGHPSVKEFVRTLKRLNYFEDKEENYLRGVQYYLNLYFFTAQ